MNLVSPGSVATHAGEPRGGRDGRRGDGGQEPSGSVATHAGEPRGGRGGRRGDEAQEPSAREGPARDVVYFQHLLTCSHGSPACGPRLSRGGVYNDGVTIFGGGPVDLTTQPEREVESQASDVTVNSAARSAGGSPRTGEERSTRVHGGRYPWHSTCMTWVLGEVAACSFRATTWSCSATTSWTSSSRAMEAARGCCLFLSLLHAHRCSLLHFLGRRCSLLLVLQQPSLLHQAW